MHYTDCLLPTQIEGYLSRLELTLPIQPDLQSLNRLLLAQLTHIPFDSLDVWGAGLCPSLQLNDLYEKMVIQKRGGYCFELNTFFRSLLNALGFDAYQCAAYILHADGSATPPSHNVIVCTIEKQKYFLDVGYGGPVPYQAMELREGVQHGFRLQNTDGLWSLYRIQPEGDLPITAFRDIPASIDDLIPLNFYVSQLPEIHFRHVIHLSRRNPDGSIYSLDGHALKLHIDGKTTVIPVDTVVQLKTTLQTYFDIDPATVPLRDTM